MAAWGLADFRIKFYFSLFISADFVNMNLDTNLLLLFFFSISCADLSDIYLRMVISKGLHGFI